MRFHQLPPINPWTLAAAGFVAFCLTTSLSRSATADDQRAASVIQLEVFVRSDSQRCDDALKYLRTVTNGQPGLKLIVHDVLKDRDQLKRLWDLAKQSGHEKPAVPMFYCCRRTHIGFTDASKTGPKIKDLYTMHVYTRWTCSRCKTAKVFLQGLQKRWPGLRISIYEITSDVTARDQWNRLTQRFGVTPGLPTVHFSNRLVVGYQGDAITGRAIENLVQDASRSNGAAKPVLPPRLESRSIRHTGMSMFAFQIPGLAISQQDAAFDSVDDLALPQEADDVPMPEGMAVAESADPQREDLSEQESDSIEVPWFGELRVSTLGFPAFTFLIGLIDGFNPCAMWVLVFLLSVLVNIEDRRKMIAIAGTFVVISGLAYFAFMAAWLNMFMLIGITRPVQIGLGSVAVFIGIVNVKDFFAFKKGLSFSIPESQKPGIYARVRNIVNAKYLSAAISAAIALAIVVNIVELLCTAGLPALYSQILIMQQLPPWANYCYLGLYNVAYMLDDSILLAIVVFTLSRRKLQEREGRWLKLISGVVILALGSVMIFKPEWLQLSL